MTSDDLRSVFGSARHPQRSVQRPRPEGVSDAAVDAAGKVSEALEVVENARGFLYAFHRLTGVADLTLQEAVTALRDAGENALAEEIDDVLVGRDVIADMWTFQVMESYDEQYYRVFKAAEEKVRMQICEGRRHVYEAEMKVKEQRYGTNADQHNG